MIFLEILQGKKTFKSGNLQTIAMDCDHLTINKGDLIAIVGPSGSGKSTLLNIIGLLEDLDSGEYKLDGKNISTLNDNEKAMYRNKYFGFIVQNFALINDFSVLDNIEIPLIYSKKNKKTRHLLISSMLKKLNLESKINSKISELSGGQAQRVAIARALINNPEVILADEPTGALDCKTGQEIINILKEINKEGKTILIVTHDYNIAKQCDKIIKINDGKLDFLENSDSLINIS